MRIAVVGAGINGIMSAWALARAGHAVDLFERGQAMNETSSVSSKLLHGGLRYLEHGELALVREGLRERGWWLDSAPHLTRKLNMVLPVYRHSPRGRIILKLGLLAYDLIAGKQRLGWHSWMSRMELQALVPSLRSDSLTGGFLFFDGKMDDRALGLWALERARAQGVSLHENLPVEQVDTQGAVSIDGRIERFDFVVNAAGPWAMRLLQASAIKCRHHLDLVRGSHLVVDRSVEVGFLLQSPDDSRVCFVLHYRGRTLIGTTEVRQTLEQPTVCSDAERAYLLRLFNAHFLPALSTEHVIETFAGLRPLVAQSAARADAVSREHVIETNERLVTVFGGKWTTSRALGRSVVKAIERSGATKPLTHHQQPPDGD